MNPNWNQIVREHLAVLRLPPEREIEIVEEVALHLEAIYDEALLDGLSAADAQAHAVQSYDWRLLECELSRVEQLPIYHWLPTTAGPISSRRNHMETLLQDLRFGVRMLLKKPGFTLIVIMTLALGIGANTAIFSVINATLLRRLPYNTERLVAVDSMNVQLNSLGAASPADFWDWQAQSQAFEQLAAYVGRGLNLKESERVEVLNGPIVSVNFFETFGVAPLLGRTFVKEEGLQNGPRAVVLSHWLWQRRFSGDPNIIGRSLKTDDGQITVIGVMPPEFSFPNSAEVWTAMPRNGGEMLRRSSRYFGVVGRIKAGYTQATAEAEINTVAARLAAAYPKENQNWTVKITAWRESLVRDSKTSLLILAGAVGFVLLIACANVANLLLTRASARRQEFAIRLALGATRGRLLRQLLTESLLLALLGGVVGLLLAYWGVEALTNLLPQLKASFASLSEWRDEIRIDRVVLLYTLGVSLISGTLFGLIPGWQATAPVLQEQLKEGKYSSSVARQRVRSTLVVVEIALALVLLVGAGLLMNSFVRMQRVDLGYDPNRLLTMNLVLPPQNRSIFIEQVLERVAATPGVESVALMSYSTPGGLAFPFNLEGHPLPNGDVTGAYSAVSPTYFRTLRVPLRAGREFNDRDVPESPGVAIINETLARQYFPGANPIGQKLTISYLNRRLTREIVGVVGDVKQGLPSKPTSPEVLVPFAQLPWFGGSLLVRSATTDPLAVQTAVQQAIWSVNKELPEAKTEAMEQVLASQIAEPRLYTLLLGIFAGTALLLAAVGIYGVMAYSVAQRTHEIGIRMALGALRRDVLTLVLRQGMTLALLGVGIGLLASLALMRLLKKLLFGVSATDPLTFWLLALLLISVTLVACWIPARRATRVDPLTALRYE